MNTTITDMQVRDLLPGDMIRTGIRVAVVESVKVGRVWATVMLVGERAAMHLQLDEVWTVSRKT